MEWYVAKSANNAGQGLIVESDTGRNVAVCYEEKDAPLIVAAPDLLEALQGLLADKYLSDPINADRMAQARAALAKATNPAKGE